MRICDKDLLLYRPRCPTCVEYSYQVCTVLYCTVNQTNCTYVVEVILIIKSITLTNNITPAPPSHTHCQCPTRLANANASDYR